MSLRKVLLGGISDFWTRYFADTEILEEFHRGTLEQVADAYKRMLCSILRQSYNTVPLNELVPWTPWLISDTVVYVVESHLEGESRYLVEMPDSLRDLNLIHNKVISPTASLERDFDFEIVANDPVRLEELTSASPFAPSSGWFMAFKKDPFSWGSPGETIPGFAVKYTTPEVLVSLEDSEVDFVSSGVSPGDVLRAVSLDGTVIVCRVDEVLTSNSLNVSHRTPFLEGTTNLGSYSIGRIDRPTYNSVLPSSITGVASSAVRNVAYLSGWIPDADKDYYSLYNLYGHPFSTEETPSTEEYRAFIQGVWNLYTSGPSLENLEAALNVVAGIPIIKEFKETIEEVDLRDPRKLTVVTDSHTYTFPNNSTIRADVILGATTFNGEERLGEVRVLTDSDIVARGGFVDLLGIKEGHILVPQSAIEANAFGNAVVFWVTDTYILVNSDDARDNSYAEASNVPGFAGFDYIVVDPNTNDPVPGAFFTGGKWAKNEAVPLTLSSFSTISESFVVTDDIETPEWWETLTIPPSLSSLGHNKRVVTTSLYTNFIGNNPEGSDVGDIGKRIGRDEENKTNISIEDGDHLVNASQGDTLAIVDHVGTVLYSGKVWAEFGASIVAQIELDFADNGKVELPAGSFKYKVSNPSGETVVGPNNLQTFNDPHLTTNLITYHPGVHHGVAWQVFNRYLKHNVFTVAWDAKAQFFNRDRSFYLDLVLSAKPCGTYPYVEPGSTLVDRMFPLEDNDVLAHPMIMLDVPASRGVPAPDNAPLQVTGVENRMIIGSRERVYLDVMDETTVDGVGEANLLGVGSSIQSIKFPAGQTFGNNNTFSWPLEWWGSYERIDNDGNATGNYSARFKFEQPLPNMTLANTGWADSNNDGAPDGITYILVDNNVNDVGLNVVRDSGRIIGGIGTTPGAFIGGPDPLFDRHELEDLNWTQDGGGSTDNYSPPGTTAELKTGMLLTRVDINSGDEDNTYVIPGDIPNTRWDIGDLQVSPDVSNTRLMYISDDPVVLVITEV